MSNGGKKMFLIQTRITKHTRDINVLEILTKPHGKPTDWENYQHQFDNIEDAKKECASLIKSGVHKAGDVRILKVACTFQAQIEVLPNEE